MKSVLQKDEFQVFTFIGYALHYCNSAWAQSSWLSVAFFNTNPVT
jgi:hypothetical protein